MLILCILTTAFIGWNALYLLSGRKFSALFTAEKLGLSLLFGFGVITIQMFIMSLLDLSFTKATILVPWLAVLAINIVIIARRKAGISGGEPPFYRPGGMAVRVRDIALITLIAIQTCYNFFRALVKPVEAYDAVSIYGLKSKMIYFAHGISGDFFKSVASNFHGAHADYPLLIPLSEAWIYTFLGSFNDLLVKAIFPLFYLSFLLIFYAALKKITQNRTVSLFFTFALASIKQFSDYSTIGVADLALGIYFSIGIFYLFSWFKSREEGFFNISLGASVLCLWTKNEGTLLALMILSIFLLYIIVNMRKIQRKEILRFAVYAFVVVFVIFSWGAFKSHNNLVNENFNLSMLNLHSLKVNLVKLPVILYEYQKQLFGFKKWNIIWILFVFVFVKELKRAFSEDFKYISVLFCLVLLGYTLVYMLSVVEINFFLRKTFSRFLLHILPVAVFWMAVVLDKKGARHPYKS